MSFKLTKLKKLYIFSFVFSLHIALSAYINSTFLAQYINENYVGLIYSISSLMVLVMLLRSSRILRHFGNKKMIIVFLIINMASLVAMVLSSNPIIIATAFVLFNGTNTLSLFCIDIFIEHYGDPKTIGKTRGTYLTIENIAWMLAPLIAVFLITEEGGYKTIYIIAFMMVAIMAAGLIISVRTFRDKTYEMTPLFETFKYLRTKRNMFAVVAINFLLQFFFAWMVVYTPIHLHEHIGLDWGSIGIIFTVMLAPFVFLGFPIGHIIDRKKIRKRSLLYIGFGVTILSTVLISFISTPNVVLWAVVLFITRIGASIIQTTSDIYFFSHTQEEDANLLGIFRNMNPAAYIISPILATLFFLVFPFKYLFLALGVVLLFGFYFIPRLAKKKKEADRFQAPFSEPLLTNENNTPNQNK